MKETEPLEGTNDGWHFKFLDVYQNRIDPKIDAFRETLAPGYGRESHAAAGVSRKQKRRNRGFSELP
jgi:hypothetical protein